MSCKGPLTLLVGTLLCSPVHAGWDEFERFAEKPESWAVHDGTAGVTGPSNTRSFLMASTKCSGKTASALRLSFGSRIPQAYRLYFVNELVPGVQAERADLTISVDGEKEFPLSYHNAAIDDQNQLIVSGMLLSDQLDSEALTALMAGRQATFNLSYNGNLMLTQSFALSDSTNALSSLHCQEPSSAIADTRDTDSLDHAL